MGIGRDAADGLAGRGATVAVDADSSRRETTNVIGEIGPADAPRVIMAGAHRDSVPAGPGMNDDGSGVVALLDDRRAASALTRLPPRSALRVGFWGGEELGLLGSRRYVNGLSEAERRRIAAYLNLDMVASPGRAVAVYDTGDRIEADATAATSRPTRRRCAWRATPTTPRSRPTTSPRAASSPASTTATTRPATRSTTSTATCWRPRSAPPSRTLRDLLER